MGFTDEFPADEQRAILRGIYNWEQKLSGRDEIERKALHPDSVHSSEDRWDYFVNGQLDRTEIRHLRTGKMVLTLHRRQEAVELNTK